MKNNEKGTNHCGNMDQKKAKNTTSSFQVLDPGLPLCMVAVAYDAVTLTLLSCYVRMIDVRVLRDYV